MQERNESNAKGVDVSHWQGDIDWGLVKKDGILFAYIKATEGVDYEDRKFSKNLAGARKAGILAGAYHFCTPSGVEDAVNEAGHFTDVIRKNGGFGLLDLPPVIDIETNRGLSRDVVTRIVRAWAGRVKEESRIQPVIYSYTYFIRDYLDRSLSDIPLWLAHYDTKLPPVCSGWKSWIFLQYTDKGRVNGIDGNVDLNEFNGRRAELEMLCRKRV